MAAASTGASEPAFASLATPGVRELRPYEPGRPIEEVERELGLAGVVKLASNESPLGPGPLARAALEAAVHDAHRYPDGSGHRLKRELARLHSVPAAAITLGNGSNDVLDLAVRAFVSPDDEVVHSEHAFSIIEVAARSASARPVAAPARAFGHDLEAMAAAVSPRTRLVYVANPNNPTGTWNAAAELEAFLARVPDDVLVMVDQAYAEYVERADYPDCIRWLERHPNLVVTRSFSKAYGLAGARVGYAVSHPGAAEYMNRVRHPFNVGSFGLAAALAALGDGGHLARSVALNRGGRARLEAGLDERGLARIPSLGNFVAVDVGGPAVEVFEGLLREGVIVRPLQGDGLPRHIRVSVGLEAELDRFFAALDRVLAA